MISSAFTTFLQTERKQCNQLFLQRQHQDSQLDGESFLQFLREQVDPVVAHLEDLEYNTAGFAMAAYQHGLDLAGKHWLGQSPFYPFIAELWKKLIPKMARLLHTNPYYDLSLLGNLLFRLKAHDEKACANWLSLISRSAPFCHSSEEFQLAGLIHAWQSGLAAYRSAALDALQKIPDGLFTVITGESEREDFLQTISSSRWIDFSLERPEKYSIQRRFGNSIVMDGTFSELPKLHLLNDQMYVTAGNQSWLVFADIFGQMLVSHTLTESKQPQDDLIKRFVAISNKLPDISNISSYVETSDTLALTSTDSFAIVLLNR